MGTKKHNIILILKILESSSDKNNPLTQIKIAEIISQVYPCDRKTVGRNIGFLIKLGYPIVKTNKGFYLDSKKFSVEESQFVINAVRDSTLKDDKEKQEILNRLTDLLNKVYR